jgi:hypothetical protein
MSMPLSAVAPVLGGVGLACSGAGKVPPAPPGIAPERRR